jgi:NAD+--asparagine ADP-ribosyltransferase
MENLQSLMQCLDDISKMIPEGTYLEMCDNLKNLHKDIKSMDPPKVDRRSIPFMPTIPVIDVTEETNEYDRWAENEAAIIYMEEQIRVKEKQMRILKIRKNITEAVKRDAVRERAQQLGLRLRSYNMENLRAKGVWISDERVFYKSYIERQNLLTQGARNELEDEIRDLENQIQDIEIEMNLP